MQQLQKIPLYDKWADNSYNSHFLSVWNHNHLLFRIQSVANIIVQCIIIYLETFCSFDQVYAVHTIFCEDALLYRTVGIRLTLLKRLWKLFQNTYLTLIEKCIRYETLKTILTYIHITYKDIFEYKNLRNHGELFKSVILIIR